MSLFFYPLMKSLGNIFFRSLFDLACLQNNEKLFNDPYIIFKN